MRVRSKTLCSLLKAVSGVCCTKLAKGSHCDYFCLFVCLLFAFLFVFGGTFLIQQTHLCISLTSDWNQEYVTDIRGNSSQYLLLAPTIPSFCHPCKCGLVNFHHSASITSPCIPYNNISEDAWLLEGQVACTAHICRCISGLLQEQNRWHK